MVIPPVLEKVLSMDKRKKFVYGLIDYEGKQPFFITDLERYYGWNNPQQDIRKVIASLIEIRILTRHEKIKGDYNFKLNKKLLKNLIRESDIFLSNGRFIESTTLINAY
jgi:hypothetical protein